MTATGPSRRAPRQRRITGWLGALAGGGVGFAISAAIYLLLNPVLEASDSWVEELQGLLWNVVPLFTLAGMILGWRYWVARSRRAHR